MAYVPVGVADVAEGWEIEIIGQRRKATLQKTPLFDADGAKMRA
jgi:dimethylglycine dehydrogenase